MNYSPYSLCLLDQLPDKPQGNDVESEKNGRVHDELRSLHLSLKPQITKLCEVLLLPVCSMFFSLSSFTCCLFSCSGPLTRLHPNNQIVCAKLLMKSELYCKLEFDLMLW